MPDQDKPAPKPKRVQFTFDGDEYSFVPDELSLDAVEAIDAEKYTVALRLILGDPQYQTFRTAHTLASDLNGMMEAIKGAMEGNSSASSVS